VQVYRYIQYKAKTPRMHQASGEFLDCPGG
jgi:hypothetical protein